MCNLSLGPSTTTSTPRLQSIPALVPPHSNSRLRDTCTMATNGAKGGGTLKMPRDVLSLKDLEAHCLASMDPMVRDYLYDGAEEGRTIRENLEVWDRWLVVPRMMRDTSTVNLAPVTPLLNLPWRLPFGIGPSAMQRLAHSAGEAATAAAANSSGVPFALSTFSNSSMENVKSVGGESAAFLQIYLVSGGRELNVELLQRAEGVYIFSYFFVAASIYQVLRSGQANRVNRFIAAGYKAVVLTVDSPVPGNRPGLIKSNFVMPRYLRLGNFSEDFRGPLDQSASNPDTSTTALTDTITNENSNGRGENSNNSGSGKQILVDPSVNWERDMPWLQEHTYLEIWVKGVLHPLDAEAAIAHGARGIIVSNHGGRQLDGCISALDALPGIVKAVRGRVPVHVDGGVRRGADVFTALALGADFVWIGRPVWWGLWVGGEEGVRWVLETLEREFRTVMMLMGCRSVGEISREMVVAKSRLLSMGGEGY
ncbi:hypothetical protein Dda_1140 [Drechslerella dactyloides]|uniref:FMN hydroxy acid dehydrogenase domain-containing protein n=1 Tax=Drechslerella dactyloides TaxID=74499 RepID=A0AAD6NNX5_DREDA|nr:hypothetical protein Dda_1140 [Drechslerella dactyloides]